MGAHPWSYFVPYQPDIQAAMESLQQREFAAGRYHSRRTHDPSLPRPTSIEDLRANYLTEEGSRSILDMIAVADQPGTGAFAEELTGLMEESPEMADLFGSEMSDFCTAVRMPDEELQRLFGTTRPTRQMIENNPDYNENIGRGCGIYIIVYEEEIPEEIFFAGYSFD